jgi:hypothetical protein
MGWVKGALVRRFPLFQHRHHVANFLERPDCPTCGTGMRLFGIEPEKPGFELHSFECPKCRRIETRIGKAD